MLGLDMMHSFENGVSHRPALAFSNISGKADKNQQIQPQWLKMMSILKDLEKEWHELEKILAQDPMLLFWLQRR
jgi:hypothetical protein